MKLVYTGIILLELNVSIVYVLIGILEISDAEQQSNCLDWLTVKSPLYILKSKQTNH